MYKLLIYYVGGKVETYCLSNFDSCLLRIEVATHCDGFSAYSLHYVSRG